MTYSDLFETRLSENERRTNRLKREKRFVDSVARIINDK